MGKACEWSNAASASSQAAATSSSDSFISDRVRKSSSLVRGSMLKSRIFELTRSTTPSARSMTVATRMPLSRSKERMCTFRSSNGCTWVGVKVADSALLSSNPSLPLLIESMYWSARLALDFSSVATKPSLVAIMDAMMSACRLRSLSTRVRDCLALRSAMTIAATMAMIENTACTQAAIALQSISHISKISPMRSDIAFNAMA
jgi:hypothetical protein